MCRQFTLTSQDWDTILEVYGLSDSHYRDFTHKPRYNIKTTEEVVTVLSDGQNRRIGLMRWGLIPAWETDPKRGSSRVNARAETLLEKASFKQLVVKKRCVVLADSFFDWKHYDNGDKQPMRFCVKDRAVFGMAGLYDAWQTPAGEKLFTCTVITAPPNSLVAEVHDRMPVILTREAESIWLDRSMQNPEKLISLLQPYQATDMYSYPVTRDIGKRGVDSPVCIRRLA
jgi:putative SOS response-associated peptidase YedK